MDLLAIGLAGERAAHHGAGRGRRPGAHVAIGDAASCAPGSPLERIVTATGDVCVRVNDPSRLSSDITTGGPSTIRSVKVQLDGGAPVPATVDSIGNYTAQVISPAAGAHRLTARAQLTDGTTVSETRQFTVRSGTRYVALGDSCSLSDNRANL